MADQDIRAAKSFYREVRKFSESAKPWQAGALWYEIKPDERHDATLVSQRVYGRRDEYLAVMAAAGINTCDQPLKQQRIVLPNQATLLAIKRRTGFESIHSSRADGAPIWLED
jgi:hypothetical protein